MAADCRNLSDCIMSPRIKKPQDSSQPSLPRGGPLPTSPSLHRSVMMTAASTSQPSHRVAVLLFPDATILDFAGPIDVLSHATKGNEPDSRDPIFSIETVSRTEEAPISTGYGTMFIQPSMSLEQTIEESDRFDILVIPGGPPEVVQRVMEREDGLELQLIRSFAKLPPAVEADGRERIILSVCTGAFLLGAAGVLGGQRVTTHHSALDALQKICDRSTDAGEADGKTEVVGDQRFVDAGLVKKGLRIVTAGGVSSGLDAALHLVELVKDRETLHLIARLIEYQPRQV